MALIAINFKTKKLAGESTVAGFKGQVDAMAIRESIEAGVRQEGGGLGQPNHSDIEVLRIKDKASPKIAEWCASGENLGEVIISVLKTVRGTAKPYMEYELNGVRIARVEEETVDEANTAYQLHLTEQVRGRPLPGSVGDTSVLAPVVSESVAMSRPAVVPTEVGVAFSEVQIERVSLNPTSVKWIHKTYPPSGGAPSTVEHGYDLAEREEL